MNQMDIGQEYSGQYYSSAKALRQECARGVEEEHTGWRE